MTDTTPAIQPDPVKLRVKLSPWRAYRRSIQQRRNKYLEGQLCLFQPAPQTLTDAGVEVYAARPRQS